MINHKLLHILTITSLATITAQGVFAMPECYFTDTRGKVVNLGFLCNIEIISTESSPPQETQNSPTNQTTTPEVTTPNQTNQPVNTNIQNLPNNTPPPSNRNTLPTF
ncbi:hypothetical protein A5482_006695 [Cyanobacterium sp. IPPAS B-1200]|uniref:hypothetical protein n=1 Tax=Cyanobacterium sp. IPPAS B-1200 TaxID=1562720 RepID=UPI0008527A74|nr:hypothetical protein [Cyanobacterium sp. IPPAS B-1200]OEJ79256.1 hypothetical protein A5482_10290 [Cyanobacterium sp. IPPAS B-1200]